jgi:hypothetical protein
MKGRKKHHCLSCCVLLAILFILGILALRAEPAKFGALCETLK